ncbi:hypothetical protein CWB56_18480, partial [Pseudoalteromonas sp. S185]|uniref:2OG-Fe dioxygenase family protein n=1 Tax=Pseudoalteromonas sp. S185 TaxID=2066522 RepID=UPI00127E613C
QMETKHGMYALINDRQVWHNATPMNKVAASKPGYLDCFVLTSSGIGMNIAELREQFPALIQPVDGKSPIF